MMATYVLLGYMRSELKGYTITLKALPLADPTNSCPPSSSCNVERRVSANAKQWSCSKPAIPTFNSYSETTPGVRTKGQQHSQSACQSPSWWRGRPPSTASLSGPVASSSPNTSSSGGAPDRTNFPQGVSPKGNSLHTAGRPAELASWCDPSLSLWQQLEPAGATGRSFTFVC
ncbi:hypothetical protein HPG69_013465 [Diceros bicornis minor]|uniref:Uncharacterized protein n=1 Tax=Diceros bicornis minor TaxID=77932 RepID=A0A7J7E9D2_DICBM|nr:hypothetical protein HPG69_013465 [Diceros bicornis minor]